MSGMDGLDYGGGGEGGAGDNMYAGGLPGQFQMPNQSDLHMFILDPKNELRRIENKLRGKIIGDNSTNDNEVWVYPTDENGKRLTKPAMNEQGINEFMTLLDSWINKNTILSHLDEKQVLQHTTGVLNSIISIMLENHWSWGLQEEKLEYIYSLVEVPIAVGVFRRAYQGRALNAIIKSVFRQEQVNVNPIPRKSGGLAGMFDRMGGG